MGSGVDDSGKEGRTAAFATTQWTRLMSLGVRDESTRRQLLGDLVALHETPQRQGKLQAFQQAISQIFVSILKLLSYHLERCLDVDRRKLFETFLHRVYLRYLRI